MRKLASLPILLLAAIVALALTGCNDDATATRVAGAGDGTWTMLVYLCGSDLESEGGMAGMDMEEMESASTGDGVRFVVETGGAASWDNDVSPDELERYVICDGDTELVDSQPNASMGESSSNAQAVLDAIDSAVVYKVNGSNHPDASGLSTYYPLQVQNSSELKLFRDVCTSANYLGLVDKVAYGFANDGDVTLLDVWDGVDEVSGTVGRPGKRLQEGDVIAPVYDCYDLDGNEVDPYVGDEYTYSQDDRAGFNLLFDGNYYYGFSIDDVFGNYYLTDVTSFSIEGDQVYFTE